jgi:hypothetical protein
MTSVLHDDPGEFDIPESSHISQNFPECGVISFESLTDEETITCICPRIYSFLISKTQYFET